MSIQSIVAAAGSQKSRRYAAPSEETRRTKLRATTIAFRTIMALLLCFILSIVAVLTLSRTGTASPMTAFPEYLLPGSLLPPRVYCTVAPDGHCDPPADTRCDPFGDRRCFTFLSYYVKALDAKVDLTVELVSGRIMETLIAANTYRIGDLIVAWGTPTGVNQHLSTMKIFWGTYSVSVNACSFSPESQVKQITYAAPPIQKFPWRGFVVPHKIAC